MQWILYSLIAFIISSVIFYLFVEYWLVAIFWTQYSLKFIFTNVSLVFPLELLLFLLIWALWWYFSSKKYLKN
jgi:hypothetical protein